MKHLRSIAIVLGLVLSVAVSLLAAQRDEPTYAVADIHGEYESFVALLTQVGLIDDRQEWSGAAATFIQTGDYTDRGPDVRRVIDLLMHLEQSAPEGRVRVLLGNHEFMNLIGDLRDTSPADFEGFRDDDSDQRQQEALAEYLEFERQRRERLGLPPAESDAEGDWLLAHPPGFIERWEALSVNGPYGRWLRERSVVVEHDDVIFMHAGIHPDLASLSVDDINDRVHEELRTFDTYVTYLSDQGIILPFFTFQEIIVAVQEELEAHQQERFHSDPDRVRLLEGFLGMGNWLSVHPEGVLWFRGFAQWTDEEGAVLIERLLDQYGVDHFVVGHTPQADGMVRSRFGERVYLADTGMLSSTYIGGQASMLEISDNGFQTIYLEPSASPAPPGRP